MCATGVLFVRQCTALHWACLANKPSAINLLLSLNCALLPNNEGSTAIDFCIKHKLVEAARAMLTNATSRSAERAVLQRAAARGSGCHIPAPAGYYQS